MVNLAYASVREIKEQLGGKLSNDDDLLIKALRNSSARYINHYLGYPDGFLALEEATTRVYPGSGKTHQHIDPCIEVTAVAVKDSPTSDSYDAWTSSDYVVASGSPIYPDFNSTPYTLLLVDPAGSESYFTSGNYYGPQGFPIGRSSATTPTVQVTARWGYADTIPEDIKEACIAMTARLYKRGEASWEDTTASRDQGQLVYRRVDHDIEQLLIATRYYRPALAGRR